MAFTYFFRDSHTLELTVQHMAPEAMGRSRIRIWDAGGAMSPEPYTLAILCKVSHLFQQVVSDAKLFKKINDHQCN